MTPPAPHEMLPMVVLAGGRGTRLGAETEHCQKLLVSIHGVPFAHYQLQRFKEWGICEVIYLTGYRAQEIRSALHEREWEMKFQFIQDLGRTIGTGAALLGALDFLPERFFVTYGDTYLTCPASDLKRLEDHREAATMTIFENRHRWGNSNVLLEDGQIRRYDEARHDPTLRYIDYGLSMFHRGILEAWTLETELHPLSLGTIYNFLIARRMLGAMETSDRFYEIGSPGGLEDFREFVRTRGLSSPQNQIESALPVSLRHA